MAVEQIPLRLPSREPFSIDYFVPHSGVAPAVQAGFQLLSEIAATPDRFAAICCYGAAGSGKSHFSAVLEQRASELGIPAEHFFAADFADELHCPDAEVARLVANYEARKAQGGVFLVAARAAPDQFTENPHLLSRLRAAVVLELKTPPFSELQPTLVSLLERRNLRLSDRAIDYLMRRVPTNPLSLWGLFAKMDDRALREGRTVGLQLIREILGEL